MTLSELLVVLAWGKFALLKDVIYLKFRLGLKQDLTEG